ncbi:MAG: hypothetical protein K4571_06485 [Deltaproteobacteria bacterium]
MNKVKQYFDIWSIIVIGLTFIFFIAALFTKGITHDLLLEAGVLLVSIKLILMAYRNSVTANTIHQKLDKIYIKLRCNEPEPQGRK